MFQIDVSSVSNLGGTEIDGVDVQEIARQIALRTANYPRLGKKPAHIAKASIFRGGRRRRKGDFRRRAETKVLLAWRLQYLL
jgi:hypothetical protein